MLQRVADIVLLSYIATSGGYHQLHLVIWAVQDIQLRYAHCPCMILVQPFWDYLRLGRQNPHSMQSLYAECQRWQLATGLSNARARRIQWKTALSDRHPLACSSGEHSRESACAGGCALVQVDVHLGWMKWEHREIKRSKSHFARWLCLLYQLWLLNERFCSTAQNFSVLVSAAPKCICI